MQVKAVKDSFPFIQIQGYLFFVHPVSTSFFITIVDTVVRSQGTPSRPRLPHVKIVDRYTIRFIWREPEVCKQHL